MQLLRSRFLVLMIVLLTVVLMAAACLPASSPSMPAEVPAHRAGGQGASRAGDGYDTLDNDCGCDQEPRW